MSIEFVGFAVGVAGVIDKRGDILAIDDVLAVGESEQVSLFLVRITFVGFFDGQDVSQVLDNMCALLNGNGGIAAGTVNVGSAGDEAGRIDEIGFHRMRE